MRLRTVGKVGKVGEGLEGTERARREGLRWRRAVERRVSIGVGNRNAGESLAEAPGRSGRRRKSRDGGRGAVSRGALCRVPAVRCCIEGGEAPGWQGAKSEHIGNMGAMSNAVRRDASPAECKRTSGTRH